MNRLSVMVAALGLAALTGGALQTNAAQTPPRVTLIGDSVATSLDYTQTARVILAEGIDLRLELAPCRRVGQSSCPYHGGRPATVIDLVPTLAVELGQTVVIAVGYNDYESAYAEDIEDALIALRKAGVTHVIWLTLHEQRPAYAAMNDQIRAAASRHPELTVADWQVYARSHPDWFQDDGIHLQRAGAEAMATLVHNSLVTLGIPLPTVTVRVAGVTIAASRLPDGVVGRPYSVALRVRGGTRPFRWVRTGGRLVPGLRLAADGRLRGVPTAAGSFSFLIRVTDANSVSATRRIVLRIRKASASSRAVATPGSATRRDRQVEAVRLPHRPRPRRAAGRRARFLAPRCRGPQLPRRRAQ